MFRVLDVATDVPTTPLGPASVVRPRAGEHTTRVVRETLRKIYVA